MRTLFLLLLGLFAAAAQAFDDRLLQRAIGCELRDAELPALTTNLAQRRPDFKKPKIQYGAPAADVYELATPVSAYGYTSALAVITPGRALLAISDQTVDEVARTLQLEKLPYSPASRMVRPTVSTVAFQLSHTALSGKVLVGCEYANPRTARWLSTEMP